MTVPLQLVAIGCDELRIHATFRLDAGRYRHSIELLQGAEGFLLDGWEDQSRSSDEDWPASPPIQQLSLEHIHGKPALLGVGQAGKSHWSISVETTADDELRPALRFDLACRCAVQPGWLGSTYSSHSLLDAIANGDVPTASKDSSRVRPTPRLRLIPASLMSGSHDEPLVARCEHELVKTGKYPVTFRWAYLVTVS